MEPRVTKADKRLAATKIQRGNDRLYAGDPHSQLVVRSGGPDPKASIEEEFGAEDPARAERLRGHNRENSQLHQQRAEVWVPWTEARWRVSDN